MCMFQSGAKGAVGIFAKQTSISPQSCKVCAALSRREVFPQPDDDRNEDIRMQMAKGSWKQRQTCSTLWVSEETTAPCSIHLVVFGAVPDTSSEELLLHNREWHASPKDILLQKASLGKDPTIWHQYILRRFLQTTENKRSWEPPSQQILLGFLSTKVCTNKAV